MSTRLSRRGFLKGMFATAAVSAAGMPVSAQAKKQQGVDPTLMDIVRENDFTLYSDWNHHNVAEKYDFLADNEVMRAHKDAGVKHIFVEFPAAGQSYFDRLYDNKISAHVFEKELSKIFIPLGSKDKKTTLAHLAKLIVSAKKHGMSIKAADKQIDSMMAGQSPEAVEIGKRINSLINKYATPEEIQNNKVSDDFIGRLSQEDQQEAQKIKRAFFKLRTAQDGLSAASILEESTQGKAIILFGRQHGQKDFLDMNDALVKFSMHMREHGACVAMINLTVNADERAEIRQTSRLKYKDKSEITYNIDEGRLRIEDMNKDGHINGIKASKARIQHGIPYTKQAYRRDFAPKT